MVVCPHDLVFSHPDICVHVGVEEEILTEHDDTSQEAYLTLIRMASGQNL
jgi:hypothetical protein